MWPRDRAAMENCSPFILVQLALALGCEYRVLKLVCLEWKTAIEEYENLIVKPNFVTHSYRKMNTSSDCLQSLTEITESRLFGELHHQTNSIPSKESLRTLVYQGRKQTLRRKKWHKYGQIYRKKEYTNDNLLLDVSYNRQGHITNYREPLISICFDIDH